MTELIDDKGNEKFNRPNFRIDTLFLLLSYRIIDYSLKLTFRILWNWHILKIEIRLIRFQLCKIKENLPNVLQLLYRFQTEPWVLTSWKSATIDSTLSVLSSFGACSSLQNNHQTDSTKISSSRPRLFVRSALLLNLSFAGTIRNKNDHLHWLSNEPPTAGSTHEFLVKFARAGWVRSDALRDLPDTECAIVGNCEGMSHRAGRRSAVVARLMNFLRFWCAGTTKTINENHVSRTSLVVEQDTISASHR